MVYWHILANKYSQQRIFIPTSSSDFRDTSSKHPYYFPPVYNVCPCFYLASLKLVYFLLLIGEISKPTSYLELEIEPSDFLIETSPLFFPHIDEGQENTKLKDLVDDFDTC